MSDFHEAWSVIQANDADLIPREEDAIRRALEAMDEADFVLLPIDQAVVYRDGAGYDCLPCPRLQLRWEESGRICHYEMVMELQEYDIRREWYDEKRSRFLSIPMGRTRTAPAQSPLLENGEIKTPYRDGCHIRWDMKHLRLPAYAVWEGHTFKIEQPAGDPA